MAGEIERAGDEDARRRVEAEAADATKRYRNIVAALRREADSARGRGNRIGREALLLTRDRHRDDAAREPGKILQKPLAVLGREHPDRQHERPRDALLEVGERIGDGATAIDVVPAVEPQLASRRNERRERSVRQPLHARRPVGLGDAGLEGRGR